MASLIDVEDRFFDKVAEDTETGCWVWQAARDRDGYGRITIEKKSRPVHRLSYEYFRAQIPDGLVIDHLCRNRACVNPWHLDPVTARVNAERMGAWNWSQSHCRNGHEITEGSTFVERDGRTRCKMCAASARRAWRQRNPEYLRTWREAARTKSEVG